MKDEKQMEDELRPEYDLRSLRVRKVGSGRKSFGGVNIRLEPDVAEMFPDSEAVNEALLLCGRETALPCPHLPTHHNQRNRVFCDFFEL